MNNSVTTAHSAEETQKIGEEFAQTLKPGDIVLLYGDLGFGKTTFVQGVARGLGIEKRIISPTFVIVRMYKSKLYSSSEHRESRRSWTSQDDSSRQARTIHLYHIDLYRVETENDLKRIGIEEILRDKTSIKLIEWPEKLGSILPKKRWEVHLNYISETEREITIKQYD